MDDDLKDLYDRMGAAVSSASICLHNARYPKDMKDRETSLDCMEHDLNFLTIQIQTLQEACYDDDGNLKETAED